MAESVLLKWGTLKGWHFEPNNAKALDLLQEYHDIGAALGAMQQRDTPRQKEIICALIDLCDGKVSSDWSGEVFTKEKAKDYVMNYGKETQPTGQS